MIAATVIAVASCSWSNPGHDRFTGTDAAVENFQGIPAPVRARLRERMRQHEFDDIATITRDDIKGAAQYEDLRDMHFGANKMCHTVERKWKPDHKEMGIVYCEEDHCLIVPTVCGNIALVTRRRGGGGPGRPEGGAIAESAGGSAPGVAAGDPLPSLDNLPPTGAGVRGDTGSFATIAGSPGVATIQSVPLVNVGPGIIQGGGGGGFIGGGGLAIPAVPEPATWASLAAGLAALGWATRRRARG